MPRRYITRDSQQVKICIICKINPARPKRSYCRDCNKERCRNYGIANRGKRNARLRVWRLKNPELARLKDLRARYKKKYNVTLEQVEELKRVNNYKCWICNKKPKRLVVDHNHVTGEVRGMLCDTCNRHLGYFETMRIENMELYIQRFSTG